MLLHKFCFILAYLYLKIINISCEEGSTLAFAIDDTRSMWNDIDQVKTEATEILKIAQTEKSSEIKNYVLVTINDPDVVVRVNTNSSSKFQEYLNRIRVHNYANEDCEEMSLTGIEKALKESRPGSYIYVFTDASAKDYRRVEIIKNLCEKKQSQVVFVLTGDCGHPSDRKYLVYHEIAAASSGQVFRVNKYQVQSVLETIKLMMRGKHSTLKWLILPHTNTLYPIEFTIDEKADYAIVSTSGKNVKLRVTTIKHPYGPEPETERVMWNSNGKVLKVNHLTPGTYYAWVKGETATSVVIYARTDFTFQHGFSTLKPTSIKDTSRQPIAGKEQHLAINVTDPEHSVAIKSVEILDMNENVIKVIPLKKTDENLYITDAFVSPTKMFKLKVKGIIKATSQPITRISKTAIEPQMPPPVPETKPVFNGNDESKTVDYGSDITLKCSVSAHPAPKIEWFTSDHTLLPSQSAVIEAPDYISYLKLTNIKNTTVYFCRATNRRGSRTLQTIVSVRPVFNTVSTPSVTKTARYAEDVKIKCDIKSYLPIQIKWFHSGKELSNSRAHTISADGMELTLNSMDLGMEGRYTCEASLNSDPSVKQTHTTVLTITGLERPVIITPNGKTQVMTGEKVELLCKIVKGHPNPKLKWYKKNGNSVELLSEETSEVLTVLSSDITQTTIYICVAENVKGKIAAKFEVIPETVPVVQIDEGAKMNVNYGSQLKLTCRISARPAPKIEWFTSDGTLLPSQITAIPSVEVPSYISYLELSNIRKSDTYTCKATNKRGSSIGKTEVSVRPVFTQGFTPAATSTAQYGKNKKIQCNIQSYLPMHIKWFHSGKELSNSRAHTISADGMELTINSMDLKKEGEYTCEASLNSDPTVKQTHTTILTITGLERPMIETPNGKTQVMTGEKVELMCKIAQGNPKPQFKWYKKTGNRVELLSGENSEVLIVPSSDIIQTTNYNCVAENVKGTITAEFEVIPETVPVVQIDEGAKMNVNYGSQLSLTCRISARPAPKMEWFANDGTLLLSQSKEISSKDVPSYISYLKLSNIKTSDTYTCRATNKKGSTISKTEVSVRPVFTPGFTPAATPTAQYGKNVKIQCNIQSYLPMQIKWFHSGKELSNSRAHTISADGMELTINSMDLKKEGEYTCEATLNSDPTVKQTHTTVLTITGLERPMIETPNGKTQVMTGEKVELMCKIVQGNPKPQLKWYKKTGNRVELLSGENSEVLIVPSSDVTQTTNYNCVAENVKGTITAEFEVIPETVPVVQIDEGAKMNVNYGSQLSLTCRISARPAPKMEWFASDGSLLLSQSKEIPSKDVPSYISFINLSNIKTSDTYTCRATNKKGSTISKTEVSVRPVFTPGFTPAATTTAQYGKDVKIQCTIQSYLPMQIKWFHSGKELSNSRAHTISADGMELTLNSMDLGMEGEYTCEASLNSDPSVKQTHTTVLTITGLERPVIELTNRNIQIMKRDKLELSCKTVKGHPKPQVQWLKKNGNSFEILLGENNEVLRVARALFTNAGQYKCIATNVMGTDSVEFDVAMSSLPEITIPETQRIFPYGSNAEITCRAESHISPTIVWRDETGKTVQNKVTQISEYQFMNKLKLENVKKTAVYVCVATNNVGYNSEYVNITVPSPFDVHHHIEETTVIPYGIEKTLRCDITSPQKIKIVWFKDNTGLKSSRSTISSNDKYEISKDGSRLKIKLMDLDMVGKYTCEASLLSDPNEKITFNTNVKVNGISRPEITYSTAVLNGKNYTAICRVKGVPKPSISWQFQPKGSAEFHTIPGSEEQYNIPELNLKHSGLYKCVVKSALGTIESDFNVIVEVPPEIINDKNVFFGVEGDTVLMIPCNVTGFPDPVIVWKKEGSVIQKGTKYDIKGNVLYINNPNMKTDTGKVACEAKNKLGTAEETFETDVTDSFDNGNKDYDGDTHHIYIDETKLTNYKIKCGLVNSESSSVRWYRNGEKTNQTGIAYIIERPSVSDDGNYTCRVNTNDGPKSETYALDVGFPPTFENNSPSVQTVDWHGDEVLDCSEQSKPVAKIEWRRNGEILESFNNEHENNAIDWGEYTCTASNEHGSIRRSFKVITSGCYLRHHMAPQNMPLLSQVNTPSMPDSISNSDVALNKYDKVKFSCPATKKSANTFQMIPSKTELIAECDTEDKFIVEGKTYRYRDLQCKTKVEPTVTDTREQCSGPNTEMLRIGFAVNGFLDAYQVCYDKNKNVPVYASVLKTLSKEGNGVDPSKFKWSSTMGLSNGKPSGGYTCGISKKCCYEKGQLVNVDDLAFGPTQLATFEEHINSIAVWNPCDKQRTSWHEFEKKIREMDDIRSIWTGASNYVNKNGGLVPRYLWKVMNSYGESSVMVYVNDESPVASDIKCTKRCESIVETMDKFLYCCTLAEFSEVFGIPLDHFKSS